MSDVLRRVDSPAALGTGIVTLSGGEPLLHPDLDEIIRRIRRHDMIATLITNGYLAASTTLCASRVSAPSEPDDEGARRARARRGR